MADFAIPPSDDDDVDNPDERIQRTSTPLPPCSSRNLKNIKYKAYIAEAILSDSERKMTAKEIEEYIMKNYHPSDVQGNQLYRRVDNYLKADCCFVRLKTEENRRYKSKWTLSDDYIFLPDEKKLMRKKLPLETFDEIQPGMFPSDEESISSIQSSHNSGGPNLGPLEFSTSPENLIFGHLGSDIQIGANPLPDKSNQLQYPDLNYHQDPSANFGNGLPPIETFLPLIRRSFALEGRRHWNC